MATKTQAKSAAAKPFSILGDTLESAAESFEEATNGAQESARRAAQTTKRVVGQGLFKMFYGISYGLVYSGVFVTELLPEDNSVRHALTEGAETALSDRRKARVTPKLKGAAITPRVTPKRVPAKPATKISARTRNAVKSRANHFDGAAAEAAKA